MDTETWKHAIESAWQTLAGLEHLPYHEFLKTVKESIRPARYHKLLDGRRWLLEGYRALEDKLIHLGSRHPCVDEIVHRALAALYLLVLHHHAHLPEEGMRPEERRYVEMVRNLMGRIRQDRDA